MKKICLFFLIIVWFQSIQSQDFSIMHDGLERTYRLHLPLNYSDEKVYPLIFSLHGVTSNGFQQEVLTGFNLLADQEGFIMVYPNGVNAAWNIASPVGVDDVGFISALIDTLASQYSINTDMVYASGMSMGGFMCYRLACELSDRIAAIASVAGLQAFSPCNPPRPVPVMQVHGTADPVVPYAGVPSSLSPWIEHNGCPVDPVITDLPDINTEDNSTVTYYYYGLCNDSTEVVLYSVINGEHSWPGSNFMLGVTNQDIDASKEIWNFFRKFNIRGSTGFDQNILEKLPEMVISPNPASKEFTVELPGAMRGSFTFRLYNSSGAMVKEIDKVNEERLTVNCEALQPGLYLAELWTRNQRFTEKLVIF